MKQGVKEVEVKGSQPDQIENLEPKDLYTVATEDLNDWANNAGETLFNGWQVLNQDKRGNNLCLDVLAPHSLEACPSCQQKESWYRHGTRKQIFIDLPRYNYRVCLRVQRQRYRCERCKKAYYQPLPEMDEKRRATIRLVDHVRQLSLREKFSKLADQYGLAQKTIRNIFSDYTRDLQSKRDVATPRLLGIDEVYVHHQYRCVLTDIENRTVYDILPNRNLTTLKTYLRHMPRKESVVAVCLDMYDNYHTAVESELPNAVIVVDRFHVVAMATRAFDKERAAINRRLPRNAKLNLDKHDRNLLRQRNREIRDPVALDRVQTLLGKSHKLERAYWLKEGIIELYNYKERAEAEEHYEGWKEALSTELPEFIKLEESYRNWYHKIFAYFDHSEITNGYAEQANNQIKTLNREGRGYKFEVLRDKIIFGEIGSKSRGTKKSLRSIFVVQREQRIQKQVDEKVSTVANRKILSEVQPPEGDNVETLEMESRKLVFMETAEEEWKGSFTYTKQITILKESGNWKIPRTENLFKD